MEGLRIILASASPRRSELLKMMGLEFDVIVSNQEEDYTSIHPDMIVRELALRKAQHVASFLMEQALVIGADTTVVVNQQILEKPKDEDEAFQMIHTLQNNWHQVYTGVALVKWEDRTQYKNCFEKVSFSDFAESECLQIKTFAVETKVYVNEMSDEEIREYIKTGESFDKAGAYGIQGGFAKYIKKIEGDFYNVMGLPVARLYQEMKKLS